MNRMQRMKIVAQWLQSLNQGTQETALHNAQQRLDPFEVPNESASAGQRELLNAEPTENPGTWVKPDGGLIKTSKEDEVEVVEEPRLS